MLVNTHNDWDPLEEIIVGRAHGARVNTDVSSHSFNFSTLSSDQVRQLGGLLPQTLIDEANEDIQGLADTLTNLGVRVHRPALIDQAQEFSHLTGLAQATAPGVHEISSCPWRTG